MPHVLAHDGTKLGYALEGSGRDPWLFVHGWSTSRTTWDDLLPHLRLEGKTAVLVDLRGSGESSPAKSPPSLSLFTQDLLKLADALGLPHVSLVGHSMGGTAAQHLAAHHPERVKSLALICPVPSRGLNLPHDVAKLFRSSGGQAQQLESIFKMASKRLPAASLGRVMQAAMATPPEVIAAGFDAWAQADFEPRLTAVTARTLLVTAEDPFLSREILQLLVEKKIAGTTSVHIEGAGHYPHLEAPAEVAEALNRFWS